MKLHRRRYSAGLKTKVALEAINSQKTANESAAEYGLLQLQSPVEEGSA